MMVLGSDSTCIQFVLQLVEKMIEIVNNSLYMCNELNFRRELSSEHSFENLDK